MTTINFQNTVLPLRISSTFSVVLIRRSYNSSQNCESISSNKSLPLNALDVITEVSKLFIKVDEILRKGY